jgi:hypothetical protein
VELETSVVCEWSGDKIAPVESAMLLWNTVFGVLDGTFESWGVVPSSGNNALEGGSQGYQGSKALSLHNEG